MVSIPVRVIAIVPYKEISTQSVVFGNLIGVLADFGPVWPSKLLV